jgi:hypothetical protein
LKSNLSHSIHPPSGCNRLSIITYFGAYGDVPTVFYAAQQKVLPGERPADLCRVLRDKTGN